MKYFLKFFDLIYRGTSKGGKNLNDASIIELFFSRDEKALVEINNKYGKLLIKIAKNLLNQKEDIDECVNSVLLEIWNQIPPDKPENLCAYTCKIARRKAINMLKHNTAEKRNCKLSVPLSELNECFSDNKSLDEMVTEKELTAAINKFLYSEDELNRNIFIRRYWYTDSISEIAAFYNLNEKTVTTKLFRIRKKLKQYLIKEGYIYE